MNRNIIHLEFPFTEDEVAAAWIIHGMPTDEAIQAARGTAAEVRSTVADRSKRMENNHEGWFATNVSGFMGGFDLTLHLVADVRAGGQLLSQMGRDLRLEKWGMHTQARDVDDILDNLAKLGETWAAQRSEFRNLLIGRRNP